MISLTHNVLVPLVESPHNCIIVERSVRATSGTQDQVHHITPFNNGECEHEGDQREVCYVKRKAGVCGGVVWERH